MEVVDSVMRHGFQHIMILNSHGGNQAINAVLGEQIGQISPDVECLTANWWTISSPRTQSISEGGVLSTGHACEFETSIMLQIAPERVDMTRAEDGGIPHRAESMRFDMFQGGLASSYRPFHSLSHNGVYGKPTLASAEKGQVTAC